MKMLAKKNYLRCFWQHIKNGLALYWNSQNLQSRQATATLPRGVPAKRVPRQAEQEFAGDTFIHYLGLYKWLIVLIIMLGNTLLSDTDLLHYFLLVYL